MSILYLLASLPTIQLNSAPSLSVAEFLECCRDWLSAQDYSVVEGLIKGHACDHPFALAWRDKETILRNAVVHFRARSAGIDPSLHTRYAHGCDRKIVSDVEDALQESSPLDKELKLDQLRWESVEELQGTDPLSIKAVFAYAVKLAIVTRWSERTPDKGRKSFDKLTEVEIKL
jgi:hypothetical protein